MYMLALLNLCTFIVAKHFHHVPFFTLKNNYFFRILIITYRKLIFSIYNFIFKIIKY